jgi:anti-anti-sigma factor
MVVSLAGEWDIYRSEELRSRLEPVYCEEELVLDLTTAKYVTSTLICALLVAQKYRHENRLPRAVLAVKSAFVRRLFNATGIDRLFPIVDNVEEALNASVRARETA